MSTDYPTDTELHAYIDLELSANRAATIKAMAAIDENLSLRIRKIRALKEQLAVAFDDFDDEDANERYSKSSSAMVDQLLRKPARIPYAAVAMLIGGLLIGFFASKLHLEPVQENWVAQVVSYQDMYTKGTIAAIETTEQDLQATSKKLSNAVGGHFVIPDLSAMGLIFKRGQVLQSNNQPVIQLAYLDTVTGEPVAVCITALEHGVYNKVTSIKSAESLSVNYVYWQAQNLDFVIIGRQLHEQLMKFAESTKAQQLNVLG